MPYLARSVLLTVGLLVAFSGGCCHTPSARRGAGAGGVLTKCTLLIPLAYNDGTAVPAEIQNRILNRLFTRFGGYTVAGTVEGAYRMADGTRAADRSMAIWVAVSAERINEVRGEAAGIARELGQESVYFEIARGTVEFVEPRATENVYDVERDRPPRDHVR